MKRTVKKRSTRWSWVDVARPPSVSGPGRYSRPLAKREVLIAEAIGREVLRLRVRAGVSQESIARRLSISQAMLSYIEAGTAVIALTLIWDLADVFGVSAQHFISLAERAATVDQTQSA